MATLLSTFALFDRQVLKAYGTSRARRKFAAPVSSSRMLIKEFRSKET